MSTEIISKEQKKIAHYAKVMGHPIPCQQMQSVMKSIGMKYASQVKVVFYRFIPIKFSLSH